MDQVAELETNDRLSITRGPRRSRLAKRTGLSTIERDSPGRHTSHLIAGSAVSAGLDGHRGRPLPYNPFRSRALP